MDFIKIDPPGGGVPTADFLTTGPTDWWINAYFVLLETIEMWMIFRGKYRIPINQSLTKMEISDFISPEVVSSVTSKFRMHTSINIFITCTKFHCDWCILRFCWSGHVSPTPPPPL